tara:strand:+ start:4829 stop:5233 length:405 start_codon:yes stop_codon:yes gene_type:complete
MRYLAILVIVCLIGCDSENTDANVPKEIEKLVGVWQLEATKISPGSIVLNWTPVKDGGVISFKSDYSFTQSGVANCNISLIRGSYTILENKITLNATCNGAGYTPSFYITHKDSKIILNYDGCIEECSYRYIRK